MEFQAVVVKIFKSFFQMFSVPDGESERLSIEVLGDLTGVLGRAEKQFQEDQGVLMALLSKNVRPASLYWFENAIITENNADQLTISVGNEQVG